MLLGECQPEAWKILDAQIYTHAKSIISAWRLLAQTCGPQKAKKTKQNKTESIWFLLLLLFLEANFISLEQVKHLHLRELPPPQTPAAAAAVALCRNLLSAATKSCV